MTRFLQGLFYRVTTTRIRVQNVRQGLGLGKVSFLMLQGLPSGFSQDSLRNLDGIC